MLDFEVVTCSYGRVHDATIVCMEQLHETKLNFKWHFVTGDALIARSRCRACSQFLKRNEAPFMIFLDGDILFAPKDVERLLAAFRAGCDLVGGMYAVRDGSALAHSGVGNRINIDGNLQEVHYLSTGFTGISRRLLERMIEKLSLPLLHKGSTFECYPFFENGAWGDIYISEDWDFSNKAKETGVTPYLDTSVYLGHIGEVVYEAKEAIERASSPVDSETPLVHELAEFLTKPIEEVLSQHSLFSTEPLAQQWRSWQGSSADFYKNNNEYLFDLIKFNSLPHYKSLLAPLKPVSGKRVIDIGCGIGTVALMLGEQGNRVIGYDINKPVIDFAKFRQVKKGLLSIRFQDYEPSVEEFAEADLLVAIDVLEHIEDLRGFLLHLGERVQSGTKFYHHDSFGNQEISPMHFDHSQYADGWFKEAGFLVWNKMWAVKL